MEVYDLVSDLEEGEILDDSLSSSNSEKKMKELPQRYVIREKKAPIPKHKKDCKHAIRYHVKKLTKMKKTPKLKDSPKRYHKSTCHREKSQKLPNKSSKKLPMSFSKKDNSSLIEEIVKSLNDDSFMKIQPTQQYNFENILSHTKSFNISNVLNLSPKGRENEFQPENSTVYSEKDNFPFINIGDLGNFDKEETGSNINFSSNVTSLPTKNEESEDEEELRRIALATFSKGKATSNSSANLVQSIDNNYILSVPEFLENVIQIPQEEISIPAPDNYEIVDMEVDEDTPTLIEVADAAAKEHNSEPMENLYVIDTNPFSDLERDNKKNILSEVQSHTNSSDEDFETDILRAELIGKLYEKKDKCEAKQQKTKVDTHPKQVSILPKRKSLGTYKKPTFSFYRKQLRSCKQTLRKTIINNKCENMSSNAKKPIVTSQVNKPTERLVIALNEESSSENSDTENPVASIEALISDCRQKSSVLSVDKTEEAATLVPKALLCLSKAQQAEYSSLRRILAEKEKLQVPSTKNESAQLTEDLKRLEENLLGCKETLKKKKEFMAHLSKEVNSKKILYMKSKLTAEHLKEQYIAAEQIRKVNFLSWSKSWNDFKNGKKTVSHLENKINELQSLCSKLGATIFGQSSK